MKSLPEYREKAAGISRLIFRMDRKALFRVLVISYIRYFEHDFFLCSTVEGENP